MKVIAFNGGRGLLQADVVKASERSTVDVENRVIGHKKVLLQRQVIGNIIGCNLAGRLAYS